MKNKKQKQKIIKRKKTRNNDKPKNNTQKTNKMSNTDPNSSLTQYFMFSLHIFTYCTKQCTTISVYIIKINIPIISEHYLLLFTYIYTNGRMLYNYIISIIICFVIGGIFPDCSWLDIWSSVYSIRGTSVFLLTEH